MQPSCPWRWLWDSREPGVWLLSETQPCFNILWAIKVTSVTIGSQRISSLRYGQLIAGVMSHHLCSVMIFHSGHGWPLGLETEYFHESKRNPVAFISSLQNMTWMIKNVQVIYSAESSFELSVPVPHTASCFVFYDLFILLSILPQSAASALISLPVILPSVWFFFFFKFQ